MAHIQGRSECRIHEQMNVLVFLSVQPEALVDLTLVLNVSFSEAL